MKDETTTVVALLHDVIEDTDYTFNDLIAMGFYGAIIEAIELMTHEEGVPYMDYVEKIKSNPIAREVKLADLRHNSDLSRLDAPTEKDKMRVEKYRKAIVLLEE